MERYLAIELTHLAEWPTSDELFDRIERRRGGKVGLEAAVADVESERPTS